jgi:anti-sigma regulatory factor (Ser/Thr protein kinase)
MADIDVLAGAVTLAYAQLPPLTSSAARARALVREAMANQGEATGLAGLTSDAELVTGELTANAIIHAGADPLAVTLVAPAAGQVLIVVRDGSPAPPVISDRPDEHGHGLRLVDAVCSQWGWVPLPAREGKQVFALLEEKT